MKWKFTGDLPVYLQIMDQMRSAVLSGEFPVGSRIPPVRELAAQAGVNPNTMQRALTELEREGLLVSSSTIGRNVTRDSAVLARIRRTVQEKTVRQCAQQLQELGLTLEQAALLLRQWENGEE